MKQTPVYFETDFQSLNKFINEGSYQPLFILVDENTHQHCLPLFLADLEMDVQMEIIEIPSGEESKTIEIAKELWEAMTALNATRKSLLMNLGGGMITDMGGFVASTFKRGIDFINVPTSLLGMVDAAIGGKTGVDLNGIKNVIGSFALPKSTFVHTDFLKTLPQREFRSGMAEMLKHGLIQNKNHWNKLIHLKNPEVKISAELIQESMEIKMDVIANDPFEKGIRKILNFGHTFGHAIESEFLETEDPYLHGEAIAIGMLIESILSYENEMISKTELDEIFSSIIHFFGVHPIDESLFPSLNKWMKHDKKNQKNQILFSLLDGIGDCKFDINQTDEQILEALNSYNRKLESFS